MCMVYFVLMSCCVIFEFMVLVLRMVRVGRLLMFVGM